MLVLSRSLVGRGGFVPTKERSSRNLTMRTWRRVWISSRGDRKMRSQLLAHLFLAIGGALSPYQRLSRAWTMSHGLL